MKLAILHNQQQKKLLRFLSLFLWKAIHMIISPKVFFWEWQCFVSQEKGKNASIHTYKISLSPCLTAVHCYYDAKGGNGRVKWESKTVVNDATPWRATWRPSRRAHLFFFGCVSYLLPSLSSHRKKRRWRKRKFFFLPSQFPMLSLFYREKDQLPFSSMIMAKK